MPDSNYLLYYAQNYAGIIIASLVLVLYGAVCECTGDVLVVTEVQAAI